MNYEDEIALWLYRFRDSKDMMGNKIGEEEAVRGIKSVFYSMYADAIYKAKGESGG